MRRPIRVNPRFLVARIKEMRGQADWPATMRRPPYIEEQGAWSKLSVSRMDPVADPPARELPPASRGSGSENAPQTRSCTAIQKIEAHKLGAEGIRRGLRPAADAGATAVAACSFSVAVAASGDKKAICALCIMDDLTTHLRTSSWRQIVVEVKHHTAKRRVASPVYAAVKHLSRG